MSTLTEKQTLLTRYLKAAGCSKLATIVIVAELWTDEAILEMAKYCKANPDASQAELLQMSSEISSRMHKEEQAEPEETV